MFKEKLEGRPEPPLPLSVIKKKRNAQKYTACFLRMMSYDAWIVYPHCFFAPSGFPGFSLPAPVLYSYHRERCPFGMKFSSAS